MARQFTKSLNTQDGSPLFSVLPGEMRDRIFDFALSSFQDTDSNKSYEDDTIYRRPGYFAPSRTECALLQTCQLIYSESWFRPFANKEHTFWLTAGDRAPAGLAISYDSNWFSNDFDDSLAKMHILHYGKLGLPKYQDQPEAAAVSARTARSEDDPCGSEGGECTCEIESQHRIELNHVRIFAQLWCLEPGNALTHIYSRQYFWPRVVTITLRHHDWWFWEQDDSLRIDAGFVNDSFLPASVVELRMELESLERKKIQIDYVASEMVKNWYFIKGSPAKEDIKHHNQPQLIMKASEESLETRTWVGTSSWAGQRWVRDESDDKPGVLSYYVKTVVWKPDRDIELKDRPHARPIKVPHNLQKRISDNDSFLSIQEMRRAQTPEGVTATQARESVCAHRTVLRKQHEERRARHRAARAAASARGGAAVATDPFAAQAQLPP